jgi:hypothetical protein
MPVQDRLTVPVNEFVKLSGIGRSHVYELLRSGVLRSVTIGKKRMVLVASYREVLEKAMREQPTYTPGRRPRGRPRKGVDSVAAGQDAA